MHPIHQLLMVIQLRQLFQPTIYLLSRYSITKSIPQPKSGVIQIVLYYNNIAKYCNISVLQNFKVLQYLLQNLIVLQYLLQIYLSIANIIAKSVAKSKSIAKIIAKFQSTAKSIAKFQSTAKIIESLQLCYSLLNFDW